jgi:hypothetical protein
MVGHQIGYVSNRVVKTDMTQPFCIKCHIDVHPNTNFVQVSQKYLKNSIDNVHSSSEYFFVIAQNISVNSQKHFRQCPKNLVTNLSKQKKFVAFGHQTKQLKNFNH